MARRQPDGRPTIYQGADKQYHCWVTVGTRPDGKPDRKHVRRKTATAVAAAVDKLLDRKKRGGGAPPKKIETVAEWLRYWLDNVVKADRAHRTWTGYRPLIEYHIIPVIGGKRLDGNRNVLTVADVREVYAVMRTKTGRDGKPLATSYILKAHRILSRALKVAHREGKAARNVCDAMDPPSHRRRKMRGYELNDAQAILREAGRDPQAARWFVGLLLGPRQGETLGLRWHRTHLDVDEPHISIEKQLQRREWQHGCDDPHTCAARHCRTGPCPPRYEHGCTDQAACRKLAHWCPRRRQVEGCSKHRGRRGCPPPCGPSCTGHAKACPARHGGGLVDVDLKSEGSERMVPLPPVVVALLRLLREEQIRRGVFAPDGYVFGDLAGRPVDPRRDHAAWEQLLVRAGVPDGRLHAARHTACSMLIASGTEISVVQELAGHTDIRTARGYVEIAAEMKRQAVARVAEALLDGDLRTLLQASPASLIDKSK